MNNEYIITGCTDTRQNVEVFYFDKDLTKIKEVLKELKKLKGITDLEEFKAVHRAISEAYGISIFNEDDELIDLVPDWDINGIYHTAEIKEV